MTRPDSSTTSSRSGGFSAGGELQVRCRNGHSCGPYTVEGYFADAMPKGFEILLSEEDIDSLVAFLLTQ